MTVPELSVLRKHGSVNHRIHFPRIHESDRKEERGHSRMAAMVQCFHKPGAFPDMGHESVIGLIFVPSK